MRLTPPARSRCRLSVRSGRGMSTEALSQAIAARLRQGYVREPHVAVEVETYRPFFVLGEIITPGQFAFVPGMTVENAVAIAGGFTPRADRHQVELHRLIHGQVMRATVPLDYWVRPGDTILVSERWL
jgi:polysaccharide biosynthesis/export protein